MTIYEGKSGVNVKRLIQNIADQYPFEPQKAALVEIIANSLDAKASVIDLSFNESSRILEVLDDGIGMDKRQFLEYHDFAATTKERGSGIGFAGQGAKLALNFCSKVVTETWSASYKGYSEWQLKGNDAPFRIHDHETVGPNHFGTKVTLYVDEKSRAFYTKELIQQILIEHYYPLLDKRLLTVYTGEDLGQEQRRRAQVSSIVQVLKAYKEYADMSLMPGGKPVYKRGLRFIVNGEAILEEPIQNKLSNVKEVSITLHGKPKVKGFFGVAKDGLSESLQGVAICVYGKVVERIWFKKEPREKERITGWIEAPYLVEAVTTDKCRFQRGNKTWEGFFKKAQAQFTKWLEEIGLSEKPAEKKADFSNLEREINSILRKFPELTFFGSRSQRDVAIPDQDGEQRKLGEGIQKVKGTQGGETEGEGISVYPGEEQGKAATLESGSEAPATPHQRTIRGGIRITYEERPDKEEEAWFDGETVTLNVSHPAHRRAQREKLINYHVVKSISLSLIEFNLEKDPEPSYQKALQLSQRFFRLWGER